MRWPWQKRRTQIEIPFGEILRDRSAPFDEVDDDGAMAYAQALRAVQDHPSVIFTPDTEREPFPTPYVALFSGSKQLAELKGSNPDGTLIFEPTTDWGLIDSYDITLADGTHRRGVLDEPVTKAPPEFPKGRIID